jgi:SAM-dependent methyltransferase
VSEIERRKQPEGTAPILDRRTLERDHRGLAELLKPGMDVLDLGCGTGAITRGIADRVGPTGSAIGVDESGAMLSAAGVGAHARLKLSFVEGDALALPFPDDSFDVVSSARMLQWLREPERAVAEMRRVARPGGLVVILDYDHTSASWEPEIPSAMVEFYASWLRWRTDAGLDNRILLRLASLLEDAGLADVRVTPQVEIYSQDDDDFHERGAIWAEVAESDVKVVADGFVEETVRVEAARSYRDWLATDGREHRLVLGCAVGKVPGRL